jgi:hypothetical protein
LEDSDIMANTKYTDFKRSLLNKEQDLNTDDIRVLLIDGADYTPDLGAHDFLDDIPGGARVAVSSALGSPTIAAGVFDTADVTLNTVTGDPCEYLGQYNHGMGGSDAARGLIALYDTMTGLPITPNGANINITVHASGWWTL